MKVPGDEKRESVVMKVSGWVGIFPMADRKKKKNQGYGTHQKILQK